MNPAKPELVDDPGMFPRPGAVVASTGKGNGWPLGATLANDLGVGGDARPVMEGELLNLSKKLFIPAGTSNGQGAAFPAFRELASNAVRSPRGGAVSPRSGASPLALLWKSACSSPQLVLEQTVLLLHDGLRLSESFI